MFSLSTPKTEKIFWNKVVKTFDKLVNYHSLDTQSCIKNFVREAASSAENSKKKSFFDVMPKKETKSAPIFALHPKGSHYIPKEVTKEVIQSYLYLVLTSEGRIESLPQLWM